MKAKHYQELVVWQRAMEVAKLTYLLVRKLPKEETYSISDQMRRAAVSIPSNIAEGHARNATRQFLHFLNIANGSKAELQTQLLICEQVGYLTNEDISELVNKLDEVGRMIYALSKTLHPEPDAAP